MYLVPAAAAGAWVNESQALATASGLFESLPGVAESLPPPQAASTIEPAAAVARIRTVREVRRIQSPMSRTPRVPQRR